MYVCSICLKEFAISFIYNLHITKCKKNDFGDKISINKVESNNDDDDDPLLLLSYKNEYKELSMKVNNKLSNGTMLVEIKNKLKELDLRISKLEKRNNKISNMGLPLNDYMNWIKSLEITMEDKKESFVDLIGVIKQILIRNKFKESGIFHKWYCGKDMKTVKLLIGKKVVGINMIIISYKWEYMKKSDIIALIDYFWNIFKMELINCYKEKLYCLSGENKKIYDQYYKNVMLISENHIVKEIKEFIINKL